jgi:phage terminase large subunit
LHGIDFGFSQDPTTAIRVYIKDNKLYIYQEAYKVGLELDDTADFIKRHIPEIEKYTIRADSARPESISYLKRHGLPYITSVKKWPGSVEDGIAHMKSYEDIIIHPQCEETIKEFTKYSYKVDQRTGDILPKIEDNHNHIVDSIRYACNPLIKGKHNRTVIAPAGDSKHSAYR